VVVQVAAVDQLEAVDGLEELVVPGDKSMARNKGQRAHHYAIERARCVPIIYQYADVSSRATSATG
jgi:hypothetical protein